MQGRGHALSDMRKAKWDHGRLVYFHIDCICGMVERFLNVMVGEELSRS